MTGLLEFELEEGGKVVVEVDDDTRGTRPVGRGALVKKAAVRFESAIESLTPVLRTVMRKLREPVEAPDEIQIEFGFKLSADFGAVIAKSETEGNFKVALTWKADAAKS